MGKPLTYRTRRIDVDGVEFVLRKQVFEGRGALGWRVFRGTDYLGEITRCDYGFHKGGWFVGSMTSRNRLGSTLPLALRSLAHRFDTEETSS